MKRVEIERLLPGIFQRASVILDDKTLKGSPLYAFLEVMEGLHEHDEAVLATLATFFNPYLASDDFVPYLATWVDLGVYLRSPVTGEMLRTLPTDRGRLRELVAAAYFFSQWRGTAPALVRFLETATGVYGFVIDEGIIGKDGRPIPFHIRVRVPKEAASYRELVERIVRLEKPAYVTAEVQFEPQSQP